MRPWVKRYKDVVRVTKEREREKNTSSQYQSIVYTVDHEQVDSLNSFDVDIDR